MTTKSIPTIRVLLPVLFSFFVMGFVDIVGTATSNIKADLNLSNTLAGLLPNFILIWFLFLSIPIGLVMNRIGRKNMVQISNVITIFGMVVPLPMILGFIDINLPLYLITFVLLGIGNTIIQVALNPLLMNVSKPDAITKNMTLGQLVKALSSLLGPQFVLFATIWLGNWNYIFIIYALITVVSMLWLAMTPVIREQSSATNATFSSVFSLFKDGYIRYLFFSILLIVGIDVGLNFFLPIIFKDIFHSEYATGINTVYFTARAIGAFICAMLLVRFNAKKILLWTMIIAITAYGIMIYLASTQSPTVVTQLLFCAMFLPVGFATANVFAIIFSFALKHLPDSADTISSLLIMGVAGGGTITFIMGIIADSFGVMGGMSVLMFCMFYILFVAVRLLKRE